MPDSDPTHDNPRDTRNLPAVVQEGEVLRPAAENWLTRAIRPLFGWKSGSLRANLKVVLDALTPEEAGFSAAEHAMLATFSACTSGASRTSWCSAPTSSR